MKKLWAIVIIFIFIPVILHFSYLFDKTVCLFKAPKTQPVNLQPFDRKSSKVLLVPLDSRPPCLSFVKTLGYIGNFEIITPPENILDNYNTPAPLLKINEWFTKKIKEVDAAIISVDMLCHGGLIASRSPKNTPDWEKQIFQNLSELPQNTTPWVYAFSIIPRLLIPENDATKLWQYHVMIYTTRRDMNDNFQNPRDFDRMQEMLRRVPPELISGFNKLYEKNDVFNRKLASLQNKNVFAGLIFGQDDGHPFGRPNQSKHKIEKFATQNNLSSKITTSYGADEVAMLQLAAYANKKNNYQPKVFVAYSDETVPDMVLHFMPTTIAKIVQEKLTATGAISVNEKQTADLILFVHVGKNSTNSADLRKIATEIQSLAQEKPLALIDLSANFKQRETVLGTLLNENVPVSCLAAYAGWNTAGNSVGTALVQGLLFIKQKESIDKQYLPYLYQKNFEFTLARILDDWAYQKDVQSTNNNLLRWQGINPYNLGAQKNAVQKNINYNLIRRKEHLFYKNIRLYPFYSDGDHHYYVTQLDIDVSLPWARTFEINLEISTKVGVTKY